MTEKELLEEKKSMLHHYFKVVLCSMTGGGSDSLYDAFELEYLPKIKVKKLGESTTLLEIPELDFERLYIGTSEKMTRIGFMLGFSVGGSSPIELALERVNERLAILNPDLRVVERHDEYDNEYYYYLEMLGTSREWEEGEWCRISEILVEGNSMMNRTREHWAWVFNSFAGMNVSVDKDIVDFVGGVHGILTNTCIECGTTIIGAEMIVCPMCQHKYARCDDCGELIKISEGVSMNRGFLCKGCATKPRCRACGRTVNLDSGNLCDRCSDLHSILDYHTNIGRQDESKDSRLKIGYEVEKEDKKVKNGLDNAKLMSSSGWVAERDGSLGWTGFELISPVLPLDTTKLPELLRPLKELLKADVTDRCGGHIHVSDTKRTPYEILLDIRGYLPLLYGLYPKRSINPYCEAKEKESYIQTGHRQAVNVTGRTLEFRIFPAVRNMEQLLFRTKLLEYMLKNKETDVVRVGELLLNEDSELYKILIERISTSKIRKRAEAFIDFANYIDRDALVLKGNKIERVIKVPQIKIDKEIQFEAISKQLSDEIRSSRRPPFGNYPRPTMIDSNDYGYFANLIED